MFTESLLNYFAKELQCIFSIHAQTNTLTSTVLLVFLLYQQGDRDRDSASDVVLVVVAQVCAAEAGGDRGLTSLQPTLYGDASGRKTTMVYPTPQ